MNLSVRAIPLFVAAMMGTAMAQQRPSAPPDTTSRGVSALSRTAGPRPFSEVIPARAKSSRGLFVIHRVDDKYFFEIHDSMMHREILVVNRISKAPAGGRAGFLGYAGDQIADNVISFER
ncbi:MAG TPA: DUF5118 domain-containing protein, partial [Flavisolibacter sp.]